MYLISYGEKHLCHVSRNRTSYSGDTGFETLLNKAIRNFSCIFVSTSRKCQNIILSQDDTAYPHYFKFIINYPIILRYTLSY